MKNSNKVSKMLGTFLHCTVAILMEFNVLWDRSHLTTRLELFVSSEIVCMVNNLLSLANKVQDNVNDIYLMNIAILLQE